MLLKDVYEVTTTKGKPNAKLEVVLVVIAVSTGTYVYALHKLARLFQYCGSIIAKTSLSALC